MEIFQDLDNSKRRREGFCATRPSLPLELGAQALDSVPFGAVPGEDDAVVNLYSDVPAAASGRSD